MSLIQRYYQYQRQSRKINIDNKINDSNIINSSIKDHDISNYYNYANYGSLIEMFQDRVSHYGDKICIRYQNQQHSNNNNNNNNNNTSYNNTASSLEFETLTFNEVDMISTYFAEEWASELTDVSCVAYILEDPVLSLLTILAILKLRRTVFPISTRNSESAIVHLLAKTQTGYLITSEKYRHVAQKCCATTTTQQQEDTSNNMDNKNEIGLRVLPSFSKDMVLNSAFQRFSTNANKNEFYSKATTTKGTMEQQHKDTIIIIHTSGTMTFPKPIYHSNQLLLFIVLNLLGSHFSKANPPLNNSDVVMLTFPLFHGHGIMSLFTIMSLGATAVLFRRLPPLARDTLSVIKKYDVTVMTLPPIQLEDLATHVRNQEQDNGNKGTMDFNITEIFQQIKYCTYSGAPLRIEVGEYLHSKGLNVRNAYGSSETGFVGGPDLSRDNKQWYNMNISTSPIVPYIYWEPINDKKKNNQDKKTLISSSTLTSGEVYQLTFKSNYPALGSNVSNRPDGGYATGDLFIEDPPNSKTWRHVGRLDDTLVMKNGEKTNPIPMESEINKNNIIKNCMVVGKNRECTAALIELAMDEAIKYSPMEIVSEVYKSVQQANVMAPSHSAIMIPQMVYILPLNKTLVTTFKGTISRQKTIKCFEEEIEQMYNLFLQNSVFNTTTTSGATIDIGDSTHIHENNFDRRKELTKEQQEKEQEDVKVFLCQAVYQVLNCPVDEIDLTTPLFDYGLDSLLAIQLRNIIATRFSWVLSITNFCFEYPTIESMVQTLTDSGASTIIAAGDNQEKTNDNVVAEETNKQQQEKRYQETQAILHGYFARIESDFPTKAPNPPVVIMNNDNSNTQQQQQQQTVLLTGATGSLGSFLLQAMIESPQIKKIYCLVRSSRSNKYQGSEQHLKERIIKAFQDRHISTPDNFNDKVHVLPMNMNAPYLGLENKTMYTKLQDEVTIIQCCGWLLDFNHTIQHFDRECIQGLYNLVKFAYRGTTRQPIHIHVVSSISATASLAQFLQQSQKQQIGISNNSSKDNNYDTDNYYIVPERASPQDPHVALPMGYAQSKYIVEHMFSYLAEYKNMPCFVERMGQLIGDTNNGAWNTSEHYPLMMVGGAAMKMMPDRTCSLPTLDWIPVDSAATAILEIMMHYASLSSSFSPSTILMENHYSSSTRFTARETASVRRRSVYHHIVNPNYITWSDMLQAMDNCGIQFDVVEPDVWVDELRMHQDNSAYRLLSYFENNWTTSSTTHGVNSKMTLWDTEDTIKIAPSLANAPVFDAQLLKKCLSSWGKIGFYVK